ncbi:major facilitator superfamily transporter [Fusarium mundagurra]|uniref:Major facilitator superfamily transporter n=1 Tax=Fusarium mundagurra TaxID=1567541 RepID=A0A8H6DH09_9HYPO|nr:major facilitator superfamily transporter [Fusarium mundagurra]
MASPEKHQNESPSQALETQEPATVDDDAEELPKSKHTTLQCLMDKVGLSATTLVLMFKGSIPPIIGISMYQSTRISSYFTTMGYLIPIISVLAVAILPRDRFIQNLILDLLAICVGSAMSLLALWSSVQARIHTSPSTSQTTTVGLPPYNSSQSAVCAVWLFANIWFANLMRAKLPSFSLPVIIYSILINNSTTSGPRLATTQAVEAFVKEQLLAMLFGMALATGVSLFIFPISSRMIVIGQFRGLVCQLRNVISLQKEYLATLARDDIFNTETMNAEERESCQEKKKRKSRKMEKVKDEGMAKEAKAAKRLAETTHTTRVLTGKIHDNMAFAKRDMAWGKLDAKDLGEMFTLIRNVAISMQTLVEAIDQGLEHTGICLEILPKLKVTRKSTSTGSDDVEAHGDTVNPGDRCFGSLVDKKVQEFYSQNGNITQAWVRDEVNDAIPRNQTQLYVALYIQQLMHVAGDALQDLVAFADKKVEDGTMKHKRLIFPTERRLWRWLMSVFKEQSSSVKKNQDILETNNINYGDSFNPKKDLEHLPATNIWQHFGNWLRRILLVLGSKESHFGFRVAAATMTVGILAFLEQTQQFFQDQRLDWAMITIALGMTITSGQSIFGFFCRVGGTCLAMIFSLIIWYIVDQKTPGVIILLWFFIFIEYYFFKFPRFLTAVMITIITQIVIIGYELQLEGTAVDIESEISPAYHLLKARRKIFGKIMRLMSSIESHIMWQRWEPNLGGRFPVETYQEIIKRSGRIMSYLTLMSYALTHPPRIHNTKDPDDGQACSSNAAADAHDNSWWPALTEAFSGVEPTNNTFLSTLALLSNSILAGQSLPPFLLLPQPYEMMPRLIKLPKDDRATESDPDDSPSLPHRDFSRGRGNPGLTTIDLRQEAPDHAVEKRTRCGPQPQRKQADVAFPGDTKSLDAALELRGYVEFIAMQVCSTLRRPSGPIVNVPEDIANRKLEKEWDRLAIITNCYYLFFPYGAYILPKPAFDDVFRVADERGRTSLHIAAYWSNKTALQMIKDHAQRHFPSKKIPWNTVASGNIVLDHALLGIKEKSLPALDSEVNKVATRSTKKAALAC